MVTPQAVTAIDGAELVAAREWLSHLEWRDDVDAEVVAELPPSAVYRAVARHYDGGWPQFQRDSHTPLDRQTCPSHDDEDPRSQ